MMDFTSLPQFLGFNRELKLWKISQPMELRLALGYMATAAADLTHATRDLTNTKRQHNGPHETDRTGSGRALQPSIVLGNDCQRRRTPWLIAGAPQRWSFRPLKILTKILV